MKINLPENAEIKKELETLHQAAMDQKNKKVAIRSQVERSDRATEDHEFQKDGVNADDARTAGLIVVKNSAIANLFAKAPSPRPAIELPGVPGQLAVARKTDAPPIADVGASEIVVLGQAGTMSTLAP